MSIRPVVTGTVATAMSHFASRVCHLVMGSGNLCCHHGPVSLVAYPRDESTDEFTVVAVMKPHKRDRSDA